MFEAERWTVSCREGRDEPEGPAVRGRGRGSGGPGDAAPA